MSKRAEAKGACLCGEVKIEALSMCPENVGACHCNMCRKWGGGPLLAVDCNMEVNFAGEHNIFTYSSSEWAERGFCSLCGTHLFYKLKKNDQYIVPVGLFDEVQKLNFDHQIFIEEKPKYYTFANETTNMTGEEVFAQFSD
ncbi:GFA family protein [Microbulbifer sp. TYP-18]|uniref:GFA family protein n=1 Tax=Microbulbifer sp. TYP-18 TaxID=3230024 RepID=UPI0034C65541